MEEGREEIRTFGTRASAYSYRSATGDVVGQRRIGGRRSTLESGLLDIVIFFEVRSKRYTNELLYRLVDSLKGRELYFPFWQEISVVGERLQIVPFMLIVVRQLKRCSSYSYLRITFTITIYPKQHPENPCSTGLLGFATRENRTF